MKKPLFSRFVYGSLGTFLGVLCAVNGTWGCSENGATPSYGTGAAAPEGPCSGGVCTETGGSFLGMGGTSTGGTLIVECDETVPQTETLGSAAPAQSPGASVQVRLNHLGYETLGAKSTIVESSAALSSFQVIGAADDQVWFEGTFESFSGFSAWGGPAHYLRGDFSALTRPGSYRLWVNGAASDVFDISDDHLLQTTAQSILNYFKSSRADDADILSADAQAGVFGSPGKNLDASGGWYDASGDTSKYLSHLSYANFINPQQIPLTAWALSFAKDRASARLGASLSTQAEQEALWGADYLVRIQDAAGFFYINVFDSWSGEPAQRELCAFERVGTENGIKTAEYQAAFREGGGMAIAALARIASWKKNGALTSAQYLSAAEKGFSHLQQYGASYCDDQKENIIDDYTALLAASELYDTTSSATYLQAAQARADALIGRLSDTGYFVADDGDRPFWHASDAGLPVVALSRYLEVEPDAAKQEKARGAISKHLKYLTTVSDQTANPYGYARQHFRSGGMIKSGFFIPHDNETGYWWQGESARLASLAAAALLGGRLAEPGCTLGVSERLGSYAQDQLDWILGKNPYDVSMLSGFGRNNPENYCVSRAPYHGHLDGGISNGITGSSTDGSGIQWKDPGAFGDTCWENWRWIEQWIPHSTWYLVALVAMNDQ